MRGWPNRSPSGCGPLGASVDVVVGRDADEAFDQLRDRVAAGVDAVVALGGDGLVNLALQVVAGTDVPLGVVPAGTGNDFARALGLSPSSDPMAAVRPSWRAARRARSTSAGSAGRWFGGVLGVGLRLDGQRAGEPDVLAARAGALQPRDGRRAAHLPRRCRSSWSSTATPWQTEAMLVAVGNSASYGGGMRVCPDASLDDGLLDVTVLGPISKPEFIRVFPTVYKGTHVRHRAVTVKRARTVSLTAFGVTAYADGERVATLPVTCEAVPKALHVLAPPLS